MITIDLLPESYKKAKPSQMQQFHRSPLAILFVIILGSLWLLMSGLSTFNQLRISRFNSKTSAIAAKSTGAQDLKESVEDLRQQCTTFQKLDKNRTQWARRLNTISDITPDGIWMNELSYDPSKGLSLKGAAIGQRGQEMASIGRFVQELKSNAALSSISNNLQIESIKTRQDGAVEIVEFSLVQGIASDSKNPKASKRR